jgi:hypothetical protein
VKGVNRWLTRFHPAKLKATGQLAKTDSIDALVWPASLKLSVRACVACRMRSPCSCEDSLPAPDPLSSAKCQSHFFSPLPLSPLNLHTDSYITVLFLALDTVTGRD